MPSAPQDRSGGVRLRPGHASFSRAIAFLMILLAIAFAVTLTPSSAESHPLAPALLELREVEPGRVEVLWKRSSLSVPGSNLQPVVPEACPVLSQPRVEEEGVAVLLRWTIDCSAVGLAGQTLRIEGLGPARIDTLVRVEFEDGRTIQRVLRRDEPTMVIPERDTKWAVFTNYMRIGFEHILSGADHLLFVFGLLLLCGRIKPLIQTVTSFTVGHSITLSLAALGYSNLPAGPIEALIAFSVLALAIELARDEPEPTLMRRYPWPMALGFGLLHGMGFAGALREVGLPSGEIPMALFSFNVGIELGQLVFVLSLVLLAWLVRRAPLTLPDSIESMTRRGAVYVMGTLAAFWFIERSVAIF